MDFITTIDLIIKDLREAREIIDDFKNYPGIPLLQVELAKSKCKSAEEVIAYLKTLKPGQPEKEYKVKNQIVQNDIVQTTVIKSETKKPAKPTKTETKIVADKFSHMSDRFNEQLGSKKKGKDVSIMLNIKPLISLDEAIGVNDRFLFIREIFNGNHESYNEAISKLNKVDNLSDGKAIIMSYTGESDENDAVKQLLDLVKRKLPSNE